LIELAKFPSLARSPTFAGFSFATTLLFDLEFAARESSAPINPDEAPLAVDAHRCFHRLLKSRGRLSRLGFQNTSAI